MTTKFVTDKSPTLQSHNHAVAVFKRSVSFDESLTIQNLTLMSRIQNINSEYKPSDLNLAVLIP